MSKSLIIAEKPSVAQDIVRALTPAAGKFDKHADHFENERYVVTSAVGHLVEIKAPEAYDVKRGKWSFAHLPVVPPHFDLAPIDKAKSRLNAVVKLVRRKDVSELINACDAGREGELIFRLIVQFAQGAKAEGVKAVGKPIRRLWLQSMTPQAIRDAFDELRSDAQMHGLADAARSRSEADWLVGINGTRAMTAFNSQRRRPSPDHRRPRCRRRRCRSWSSARRRSAGTWRATTGRSRPRSWPRPAHYDGQVVRPQAGRRAARTTDRSARRSAVEPKPMRARSSRASARPEPAAVSRGDQAEHAEQSPLLYDLTTLQREANGRFGFSAKTTLALAQALYERHKALTYPPHRLARAARGLPRRWRKRRWPCWPRPTCPARRGRWRATPSWR